MADSKFKLKILFGVLFLLITLSAGSLAVNHPPILSPIGSKEVAFGETLSFSLSATDPDNDQIFFSSSMHIYFSGTDLPANAFLNPKTGDFKWTPEINQLGNYLITFRATDNGSPGMSTGETVTIKVVYRLVHRQKAWGFGLKKEEKTVETSEVADLVPKITKIGIDGQAYSPSQTLFYVSENPKIRIEATSPYRIVKEAVSASLDRKKIETLPFFNVQTFGEKQDILSLAFEISPADLSPGEHALNIQVGNELGYSSLDIVLTAGKLSLIDKPLAFPVPFRPSAGGDLTLQYSLSQDADINIYIASSSGEMVKKLSIPRGEEGAKAGMNKFGWDGRSDMGNYVGNGIYLATIVSREERKVLGKLKLVIY